MPKGHWKYIKKNPTKSCVFYKQYICTAYGMTKNLRPIFSKENHCVWPTKTLLRSAAALLSSTVAR